MSTADEQALAADIEYLRLVAASIVVPVTDLVAFANAPDALPHEHRAIIESFLRIDPDCTLADMLADRERFDAAAAQLQQAS